MGSGLGVAGQGRVIQRIRMPPREDIPPVIYGKDFTDIRRLVVQQFELIQKEARRVCVGCPHG